MSASRAVMISGAAGFLGRHLCRRFAEAGWEVRALVRDPGAGGDLAPWARGGLFRCDLPDRIDPAAFDGGAVALIHCAYDTRFEDRQRAYRTNVEGTRALLSLSREHAVGRFVFLSSLSAHEEAESFYGRSKLEMERLLDPERDLILRLGMVVGNGGLFQRLRETVRKQRVIPLFFGGRQGVQTVWIDDLCETIEGATSRGITGRHGVGEPEPVSIRRFLEGVASLEGRRHRFVRLPGGPALLAVRILERAGLRLPISSENLLGLKHQRAFDLTEDLARLGAVLRPYEESLRQLAACGER